MSETVTSNEKPIAGPVGRVRSDLINFFAATAMVGTFSLGLPQSRWFFFTVAGLTLLTVLSYLGIKFWMKYKKDKDIKESEARFSAISGILALLVAVTCGVLTFRLDENQTTISWVVFNGFIACLVLMQILFLFKREKIKTVITWLTLSLLSLMCTATIVSTSLSAVTLNRAANSVVIAGLVCWLGLEAIGCVDNLSKRKNTEEYAGIKFYWIKNVLQILAALAFITFLIFLLINLNDEELNNFPYGNALDAAPIGSVFFFIACGTTAVGVIMGVYCGFRHFLNKIPAGNDANQFASTGADLSSDVHLDDEVARSQPTRRRDALKRASRASM